MEKISILIKTIVSIPKTIYANFAIFDLRTAIRFPLFVSNNVKLKKIYKGCIKIDNEEIKTFMIKIGVGGSNAIVSQQGIIYLNEQLHGRIVFYGEARFAEGIRLYNNTGTAEFGNNFIANKNCFIACDKKVSFGNDVLLGWNINIRDSDGHKVIHDGMVKDNLKSVIIGNHVWICSNVDILKGSMVGNNCVIGYRSCLTGIKTENNKLICGYPAKVLKENINWEK